MKTVWVLSVWYPNIQDWLPKAVFISPDQYETKLDAGFQKRALPGLVFYKGASALFGIGETKLSEVFFHEN